MTLVYEFYFWLRISPCLFFLRAYALNFKKTSASKSILQEQAMDAEIQTDTLLATPEDAALPKQVLAAPLQKGRTGKKGVDGAELAF